jgi:hypothetical protein
MPTMKRLGILAIILTATLAGGAWLRARVHQQVEATHSRVSWRPAREPTPGAVLGMPNVDPASIVYNPKMTASAEVLPGRRVKVTARLDVDAKPDARPHLYMWKLEFLHWGQGEQQGRPWQWLYDQRVIEVKPGTHAVHDFSDTVTLPPGIYLARVWVIGSHWEDTVDGYEIWPDPPTSTEHGMKSRRVAVK